MFSDAEICGHAFIFFSVATTVDGLGGGSDGQLAGCCIPNTSTSWSYGTFWTQIFGKEAGWLCKVWHREHPLCWFPRAVCVGTCGTCPWWVLWHSLQTEAGLGPPAPGRGLGAEGQQRGTTRGSQWLLPHLSDSASVELYMLELGRTLLGYWWGCVYP